jgi:hypothetical protein
MDMAKLAAAEARRNAKACDEAAGRLIATLRS